MGEIFHSANRPLSRSIIKIGVRLFLGRSKSHFQDWLPGLKIISPEERQQALIRYRSVDIVETLAFADVNPNKPDCVFIVGSGPSINQCAIEKIPAGSALLLNGAISLIGSKIQEPLAVVVEDERFVWRHFTLLKEKVPQNLPCLLSISVIRAICEIDSAWLRDRKVVLIRNILAPYGQKRRSEVAVQSGWLFRSENSAVSIDPDKGIFPAGSVAATAMQFALASGATRIGLFGIDISNANLPRFYENETSSAYTGILSAERRILAFFAAAKQYAGRKSIELDCFSPVSALLKIGYRYDGRFEND
ncbi:hypothetical protein SAMN02927900_03663 [Rhizobium mongolense subsp. loessense]|uniref:Glycosyl transferase n=1 Tax=Rhizobium mongolense subsp. loessense TaxID=158890 RepID=A0A1G4SEI0_9HYPH|nr:glycosyl transferase [Rhizobium mongolense]SCW66975.1 hypothetical protein SAMN02927900_03663 [Rhizobium mongolense subsp. loessense]